ncbi:MAG TPA: endolytic transglycosylase MltG [Myxococcales bacterium]|jgi:UPF0755 protein
MKRIFVAFFVILLVAAGFALFRYQQDRVFAGTPFGSGTRVVTIAQGTGPRALGKQLAAAGVVSDEKAFYQHLHWFRRDKRTRAGEYQFDGALTPDQVIDKLVRGEVKLYHFTVPEGLRADEIAPIIGATGLCSAANFLKLARDPSSPKKFGVPGPSMEGYLFPDTYTVTRNASGCAGIMQAMVARFQKAWAHAQAQKLPTVNLNEREGVTLASIVEKETGQPEERGRISCVFHNRLKKNIPLGTDPTVIYSVLLQNDFVWDGNLHKSDLVRPHPYNTYVVKGLPPGPISNPGQAAMDAAMHPIECNDLFFVSRNDHTHVFCPDLKCHEAAVQKWQIDFFKHKKHG